jgi:hypothetical protein
MPMLKYKLNRSRLLKLPTQVVSLYLKANKCIGPNNEDRHLWIPMFPIIEGIKGCQCKRCGAVKEMRVGISKYHQNNGRNKIEFLERKKLLDKALINTLGARG